MYVWDPFQSVASGSGTPAGWTGPSFGSGLVEPYSGGAFGEGAFTPHQWFAFDGNNLTTPTFTPVANITVWFAWIGLGNSLNGTVMVTNSPKAGGGADINTCIMQIEHDNTISFYVGPGGPANFIANTGSVGFSLHTGVWYYFQVNITLGLVTVGGIQFLSATVDLAVDGVLQITGRSATSNFFIDSNFVGDTPNVESISWSAVSGGNNGLAEPYVGPSIGAGTVGFPGNLWQIIVDTPGTLYNPADTTAAPSAGDADLAVTVTGGQVTAILPTTPHQLGDGYAIAPGITITDSSGSGSGATAHAILAPSPFRRVPQAVVEAATLPTTANVRVPQMVIEVATLAGAPPPPPVPNAPSGGGGRGIFRPVFCLVPPPGKPKYKGCGVKPKCFAIPEREWVDQVPGSIAFNPSGVIPLPAPGAGDTVIFSFRVPIGYDGMILGQYNTVTADFAQGSGDIVWRISAAGRYLRDRGNILVSIGTPKRLYPVVGGLQLRSGNLVEFIVNAPNTGGSLPFPGAANVLAGLHGWLYPRK
jgi:hypothetical protein